MFEVKDFSIKINDERFLVRDLSFTLNKGDKLAIIGEEGNGKSTLLKSLLGLCDYAEITGFVNTKNNKIGYLKQSLEEEKSCEEVYNFLFADDKDYYESVKELHKYLELLSLNEEILHRQFSALSGGERVKIWILKLILEDDDILFLDEPTNDLDIETLKWLEDFINNTAKPVVYVSHDETLLSHTATAILHLEQINKKTEPRCTLLKMDYDTYVETRLKNIEKQTQVAKFEKRNYDIKREKLNRIMQRVEYDQRNISRSDPAGAALLKKKMHSLKAQEKKMNDTPISQIPDVEEGINFFFEEVDIPKNKVIFRCEGKKLIIGDKLLSQCVNLEIVGNTHLCITGKNGVGKTTLIRHIYSELKNRADIKVGYMPQNYDEILSGYEKVLDYIASKNKEDIKIACTRLSSMKFTREEILGKIENLSNGSKAKLLLMKLVLDKCNVLILDEPTRNVSPLSNPVIRMVLKNFKGTIISVSRDRKFIREIATEIYLLDEKGIHKESEKL